MRRKNKKIGLAFAAVLMLAFISPSQLPLPWRATAQERNINVNEALDLNDLKISNEVRQINSLSEGQAKLLKLAEELKQKSILSPRDPASFKADAEQRKSDLVTIQRQIESIISKLKQGNHWNDEFDARVLAAIKSRPSRSVLSQAGGARKLFETALSEVKTFRDEIDEEINQVNSKQVGARLNRTEQIFAAHARPMPTKIACNYYSLMAFYAWLVNADNLACTWVNLYNSKGCTPKLSCN